MRFRSSIFVLLFTISLSGLQFGYNTAVIAGALLFLQKEFSLSTYEEGVLASILLLGAILGSCLAGSIANAWGRKRGLHVACVLFLLGGLLAFFAPSSLVFSLGRIFQGVGVGLVSVLAPLYLGEMAPSSKRGQYVSYNQLAITLGILLAYAISAWETEGGNWRHMIVYGPILALVQAFLLFFLPESPSFTERKAPLEKKTRRWKSLFLENKKPLLIGTSLSIFQQITGINGVIYFAPKIFTLAGYPTDEGAALATLGLGIVNVLATGVSLRLVDRWGRRPLLLLSLAGMCLSLLVLAVALKTDISWIDSLSVGALMVYIVSFAIGMGPIPWIILAEIFPLSIRGDSISFAVLFNWAFNYIVVLFFLDLIQIFSSSGVFFLFSFLSLFAWIFVWKKVEETKNRTLA